MNSGNVKRKRGKSNQSAASKQRPAKRSPQYLSHVEVPSARSNSSNDAAPNNLSHFAKNGDINVAAMSPPDSMDLDETTPTTSTAEEGSKATTDRTPKHAHFAPDAGEDRMARLRQVIETEFDLEILLKHNELRLIDQEIAKCQVALEQLRRCSIIPYPATSSNPQDMLNVSSGIGIPQPGVPGVPPADQPPPWGVVDGPYSRHYSQWLLPDRTFDGGFPEEVRPLARAGKTLPERHTRGGKAEKSATTPKARAHRGTGHSRLHALPAGYPEHKEDKGPMILKRASDGKFVKLVCPNCHRENFNSAQGFINHCRIAHSHNLASHEVAARECGKEIDPNEVVMPPPDSAAPQSAHPSYTPTAALVHPLIRGSMVSHVPTLSIPTPKSRPSKPTDASSSTQPKNHPPPTPKNEAQSFAPSPQVPHLSALLATLNHHVNLPSVVEDATTKEDLAGLEVSDSNAEDSDFEMEDAATAAPVSMSRIPSRISTRGGPANTTTSSTAVPGRPKSRKGLERAATARRPSSSYTTHPQSQSAPISTQPRTRPATSATTVSQHVTLPPTTTATPQTLSPHTVESNNAPSLVSDNESDNDGDYQAQGNHSSPSTSSTAEDSEPEEAVDVDGDVEMRGGLGDDVHGESTGEEAKDNKSVDLELKVSARGRTKAGMRGGRTRRGTRGKATLPEPTKPTEKEVEEVAEIVEVMEVPKGRGAGGARRTVRGNGGGRRRGGK
ncbi:hypothetical protein MMC10_001164 [Thelotrema lepadinum]|nr:hypothetical protein [Thelotrema lepadinum]